MSERNFTHLHVHTEFSLLDGLSRIKPLVNRAKELGMPALAITDHGTMFGVIDFFKACKDAGIKPIIGVEAYLAPRGLEDRDPTLDRRPYHMLLLAQNQIGYQNLLKLTSEAQIRGYYYRPRIDFDLLAQHSEGLIATTGCLAAKVPSLLMQGREDMAREEIGKFLDIFGADRFYLEIQHHDIPEVHDVNRWLVEYNRQHHTNVGLLATNDTHYVLKDDFDAHDTLLCIQTNTLKSDSNRMRMSDNSYYLSSPQEMWSHFGEVPEALHNSLKIADMSEVNLEREDYHLPVFPVPEGHDAESYLRHLCQMGMKWRFGDRANDPVLQKRLEKELSIVHRMGFDTYFLIVWDLCEYARMADIWWNVRGSGAGSLAAFCLGITNIDPIQNNLLFERFLNPGRISMPDIDLDYPDDRRGEMIAYTARKYGEDKVAAIITFGTLGAKAAVRDVGRALDVPLADVNRAAALIPTEAKQKRLDEYVSAIPELQRLYNDDPRIRQVIDTAKLLQGVSRHASTHAAGVIVADKPLTEYIPLHRVTGKDPSGGALKAVTQFPMETCEEIGLLKVDFLGLSTLTILRKAADLIEKHHGTKYTMDTIPYRHDDPHLTDEERTRLDAAFELMGNGETVGVFQVESSGMQQMLRDMRPRTFENIVAGIALYRPGPMEFIPQYNRRLHGDEQPSYRHPKLEPILSDTYGIIVYQEQIMQIAGDLFGYELGEGDTMRKAVSKKRTKDLVKHRKIFLERGPEHGVDADTANKIFDDIEFFANYGFNKAHASDYAVITVQTAYLKTHYPEEYMAALLTVHYDDSAKVAHFLEECRRLKIPILPPNVNFSMIDFDIQPDPDTNVRGIRFGLAAIKNAGSGSLKPIIDARSEGGPFEDLVDFCHRVDLREVGKRTLESLIKVGAMQAFGKRSQLLDALDRIMSFSANYFRDKEIGQMSMFGDSTGLADDSLIYLNNIPEINDRDRLDWEKELLGLYVSGRPVDKYRDVLQRTTSIDVQTLKQEPELYHDKPVRIAGEIVNIRRIYTKNNQAMAVIHVEDWHDTAAVIEVVIFPRTWTRVIELIASEDLRDLVPGEVMMIIGKFDASRGDAQIICDNVTQNFDIMDTTEAIPAFEDDMPVWALDSEPMPPPWDEPDIAISSEESTTPREIAQTEDSTIESQELQTSTGSNGQYNPFSEEKPRQRYRIEIHLPRTGDHDRDRRLLAQLHGILTSYPGHDHFVFSIEINNQAKYLAFPEHSTGYCDALHQELLSFITDDDIIVIPETITMNEQFD